MSLSDFDSIDAQDRAETLDETNLTQDGEDIANFDMLDDVFDVTQVDGDADEDLDRDFIDDDELDEIEDILESGRDDEGLDARLGPLEALADDGLNIDDTLADDADSPADFESETLADDDIEVLGYADER